MHPVSMEGFSHGCNKVSSFAGEEGLLVQSFIFLKNKPKTDPVLEEAFTYSSHSTRRKSRKCCALKIEWGAFRLCGFCSFEYQIHMLCSSRISCRCTCILLVILAIDMQSGNRRHLNSPKHVYSEKRVPLSSVELLPSSMDIGLQLWWRGTAGL